MPEQIRLKVSQKTESQMKPLLGETFFIPCLAHFHVLPALEHHTYSEDDVEAIF
jgi:hypothetical protein